MLRGLVDKPQKVENFDRSVFRKTRCSFCIYVFETYCYLRLHGTLAIKRQRTKSNIFQKSVIQENAYQTYYVIIVLNFAA